MDPTALGLTAFGGLASLGGGIFGASKAKKMFAKLQKALDAGFAELNKVANFGHAASAAKIAAALNASKLGYQEALKESGRIYDQQRLSTIRAGEQDLAAAEESLVARGLSGTTIREGLRARVREGTSYALGDVASREAATRTGLIQAGTGQEVGLIGTLADLEQQRTGQLINLGTSKLQALTGASVANANAQSQALAGGFGGFGAALGSIGGMFGEQSLLKMLLAAGGGSGGGGGGVLPPAV